MMRSKRRRTDRPGQARRRLAAGLEALESRQLLASTSGIAYYQPQNVIQPTNLSRTTPPVTVSHPIGVSTPAQLNALNEAQKVITGKNRQGDEYVITVHGPGAVIVTDATPNDGIYDDDIDTIQLINTTKDTVVEGQVVGSARINNAQSGTIFFNHLYAANPLHSIVLNGFSLARTLSTPVPANPNPEIFLPGGVEYLSFQNIEAQIDQATNDPPFNIVIGDPTTPLTKAPVIHLEQINNTVINSNAASVPNGVPLTTPTVNIIINGQLHDLSYVSSGSLPLLNAGDAFNFPPVSITGRTSIQAVGIDHLKVVGSARNTTASRTAVPFQHGFSGLDHLNTAEFGGNADAVGLDVKGPIHNLKFLHGVGNPAGTGVSATSFGMPSATVGYPGFGFEGGRVTATKIDHLTVGAADLIRQIPTDPDFIQSRRQGSTTYFTRPGTALTNATIVSSGRIGHVTVVGNSQTSEIQAGSHYPSYLAGLEPVRSPSIIRHVRQRGDVVDAVVSSTYRSGTDRTYGTADDIPGPGQITGTLQGHTYSAGLTTPLGNKGTGFFAARKVGYLPPPSGPIRNANGVIVK